MFARRIAYSLTGRLGSVVVRRGLALVVCLAAGSAAAVPADSTNARAIMTAVHRRPTGDRTSSRMKMVIKDPGGSQRVRAVRARGMEFDAGTKQLILFESPADVLNTGLLTIDYDDGTKVDDQWLYLPSLRKSTRISSSKKSGAFMGSDISFADMTKRPPEHYQHKIVKQSTKAGGDDCWLVESRPKTERAAEETGYLKSLLWVSKPKLMLVQAKHWIKKGRKLKLMKFADVRQVGKIWFAHKILARTVQSGRALSTTIITFSRVKVEDAAVKATDFTQRRLEQGL